MARAVARAVKRQAAAPQGTGANDEEVRLFALILKKNALEESKCEENLKNYLETLKNATLELKNVHKKLNNLNENEKIKAKCKEIKTKIQDKCTGFEKKIEDEVKKQSTELTNDDCKANEQQCTFLEEACPNDLTKNCNKLRNLCYQKERERVAEKALLKGLSGALKNKDTCKKKIEDICIFLKQESDELMILCLNQETTCNTLVEKAKSKCSSLKQKIENLLTKDNELEKKCSQLLSECYFYGQNCENDPPKCDNLEKKCKKKSIIYTAMDLNFDPTKPETTLIEKIGLEDLYTDALKKGVYIGRPPPKGEIALLALLTLDLSDSNKVDNRQQKCEQLLGEVCKNPQKHKVLQELCKNKAVTEEGKKKCKELGKELAKHAQDVSEKIIKYLIISNPNKLTSWHELYTFISKKECVRLQSDCFYLKGQDSLEKLCDNLKAACYKKGLEALANKALQDKLRGKLHGSNGTWFENLQKSLVEVCKELKGKSDELFVLCVQPKKAALVLSTDLRFRAIFLREQLNEKRDYPTGKDCIELKEECSVLIQDSEEIKWPCNTLNEHCIRLEGIKQLEKELLEENKGYLKDEKKCKEEAGKRCEKWLRRGNNKFSFVCSVLELACMKITANVKSKCNALKEHMKARNVITEAANKATMEKTCRFWTPYCQKFISNCDDLKEDGGNDGDCKKLNKNCELFFEKKKIEDKAIDELKGSLLNNTGCEETLKKYCTQLNNATNGLETLCKENGKDEADVRKEQCKKLVKQVQEKCLGLKNELTEIKNDLEIKEEKYKKIKEEAEKAMENANLILSRAKGPDNNNKSVNKDSSNAPKEGKGTTGFKLVRRNEKVHVTEKELTAFDLVARTFDLYLELKEICNHSLKNCGFKKECDCEDPCKKIQGICSTLEPLKVKPHEI
ncbi:uncharacterized protein T551_01857, partial [Pneumocystis jirovecii RU7]